MTNSQKYHWKIEIDHFFVDQVIPPFRVNYGYWPGGRKRQLKKWISGEQLTELACRAYHFRMSLDCYLPFLDKDRKFEISSDASHGFLRPRLTIDPRDLVACQDGSFYAEGFCRVFEDCYYPKDNSGHALPLGKNAAWGATTCAEKISDLHETWGKIEGWSTEVKIEARETTLSVSDEDWGDSLLSSYTSYLLHKYLDVYDTYPEPPETDK